MQDFGESLLEFSFFGIPDMSIAFIALKTYYSKVQQCIAIRGRHTELVTFCN